jgi:hypothetical protein
MRGSIPRYDSLLFIGGVMTFTLRMMYNYYPDVLERTTSCQWQITCLLNVKH